ncbi:MAG: hypothetical protein DRG78_03785 [Epsilonproteobacteria bacterium]|nr:MAG: hypothetical protein DRG78_03785 [Campylobacterota bacterium]
MAQKKYTVSQKLNLDGQNQSRSFAFIGEKDDLDKLVALMEGEISIKETISTVGDSDALVDGSTCKRVSNIKLGYKNTAGDYLTKYISSFDKRQLIFKASASKSDIETSLINATMLLGETTNKPRKVDADLGGTYAPAAAAE